MYDCLLGLIGSFGPFVHVPEYMQVEDGVMHVREEERMKEGSCW